jgi:hypothetical protein
MKAIEDNQQVSRRDCMLWMFQRARKKNSNVQVKQFCFASSPFRLGWQQNNLPIEIWSLKVFEQKLVYIHNNPVESGFVTDPIDWKYSSARNYGNNNQTVLEIDLN